MPCTTEGAVADDVVGGAAEDVTGGVREEGGSGGPLSSMQDSGIGGGLLPLVIYVGEGQRFSAPPPSTLVASHLQRILPWSLWA